MTKSTLTRERLEKIKSWRETYGTRSNVMLPAEEAEELARMALAAMDSEPVGEFYEDGPLNWYQISDGDRVPAHRRIPLYRHAQQPVVESEPVAEVLSNRPGNDTSTIDRALPVGTQLYRHAQPAPVVPEEATPDSIEILASARRRDHAVFQWDEDQRNAAADSWNACRAAMLQAKSLTSINPAPTLVSLPKNAKSLTGNSPVIGIDLASGPDRTVEVHYVVPPGYVVVPKEPTDEMIAAAMNCKDVLFNSDDSFCIQFVNIYEAMLAAAPKEVK